MQTFVILPARYGSTRFEGKPLANILGKPMIQHAYERCRRAEGVTRVVVATDDPRIFNAVTGFGGEAVMTRSDHPSGTDRIAEAVDILGADPLDIVINVQGDQPAFNPKQVQEVAQPLIDDPDLDMSTPIIATIDPLEIGNPNHVKVVFSQNHDALYFSRAPIPWPREGDQSFYFKHIGIYGYRVRFLRTFVRLPEGRLEKIERLEQLRALEHGYRIRVVITDMDSVEVDRPADLAKVEAILKAEAGR
jgi:3-deoxy-manno-octulosonate cytidylyltransferase (CMP-KDO synthetase)